MKFVKVKRKPCLLQKKNSIACGFKLYCKRYLDFQQLKTEAFNRRWAKTEKELENKNGNVQFVCRMDAYSIPAQANALKACQCTYSARCGCGLDP